jgi:hypothetical protein
MRTPKYGAHRHSLIVLPFQERLSCSFAKSISMIFVTCPSIPCPFDTKPPKFVSYKSERASPPLLPICCSLIQDWVVFRRRFCPAGRSGSSCLSCFQLIVASHSFPCLKGSRKGRSDLPDQGRLCPKSGAQALNCPASCPTLIVSNSHVNLIR